MFFSSEPWNVAYSLKEEHQITRGALLTILPTLEKEWKVSFDFKASSFGSGLKQIFHMTTGGNRGRNTKLQKLAYAVYLTMHVCVHWVGLRAFKTKVFYIIEVST